MSRTSSAKSDIKFNSSSGWQPHPSGLEEEEKGVGEPLLCCSSVPVSAPAPTQCPFLPWQENKAEIGET